MPIAKVVGAQGFSCLQMSRGTTTFVFAARGSFEGRSGEARKFSGLRDPIRMPANLLQSVVVQGRGRVRLRAKRRLAWI